MALQVRGLTVRFGNVLANDQVDLTAQAGAVTGVIGPNGAGKSTLMDAIGGFLPAVGSITLNGTPLTGLPAHRRARAGLGRTFQGAQLFDDLTAQENLAVAADGRAGRDSARPRHMLQELGIEHLADHVPSRLSLGQRRLVALGRALVLQPTVLLMDEPAAGLSQPERTALGGLLSRLAAHGTAVVLVDHDVDLVLRISAHVHVLSAGRLLAQGPPDQMRASTAVREAYLGGTVDSDV